jgi:acyl-CoA thioester hydrolase
VRVEGAEYVMRASDVEYHGPARFDELLECFVRINRLGRSSITYECAAYRLADRELMVTATQTLVLIDLETRRPTPVPEGAREPIRAFEGDDLDE